MLKKILGIGFGCAAAFGFFLVIVFPFVSATVTMGGQTLVERVGLFFGGSGSVADLIAAVEVSGISLQGIYLISMIFSIIGLICAIALAISYVFEIPGIYKQIRTALALVVFMSMLLIVIDVEIITNSKTIMVNGVSIKIMHLYRLSITAWMGAIIALGSSLCAGVLNFVKFRAE